MSAPTDKTPAVELLGVRRQWGNFRLNISLCVPRHQYLVILGPSGCGKSLLLSTIAGLHAPTGGQIRLQGIDATLTSPEARQIGFVFQHLSLFPHLTVTDNIAFGLRSRGASKAEAKRRVDELVALLRLEPLISRAVPTLSGGESQKVALARALAPRPDLLLLDEPLSLVDHNTRIELQGELRRLHGELGLTTLHVTHNREEARAQAHRCAVMFGGGIIQAGTMEQITSAPSCVFVSGFLGLTNRPPQRTDCAETCFSGAHCDRARIPTGQPHEGT